MGEDGDDVRKGVTVILPRHPDDIHVPSYAALHTLNGNGEVTGSYQIRDWGFVNTVCSSGSVICLVSLLNYVAAHCPDELCQSRCRLLCHLAVGSAACTGQETLS